MQATATVKNGAGETLAQVSGSPTQVGKALGKVMAERGESVVAQVKNLRKGQEVAFSDSERKEQDILLDNVQSRADKISDNTSNYVRLGQEMVRMGMRFHKLHDQQERADLQCNMLKITAQAVSAIDEQIALLKHSRKDTLSRLTSVVDIKAPVFLRVLAERRVSEKQLAFRFSQERKEMKVWHDMFDRAGMDRENDE